MPTNPNEAALAQYRRFKAKHEGCLLLFRIGDFYEMFEQDAIDASSAIGLTLTQRPGGMPMAGIPCHQLETYLKRFIAKGFRVAVCEHTEQTGEQAGERATRAKSPPSASAARSTGTQLDLFGSKA